MATLTPKQLKLLRRLANGDRLHQHWNTGRCRWMPQPLSRGDKAPVPETKSTVDMLHDRGLVTTGCFVYFPNGAYLEIEITQQGQAAVRANVRAVELMEAL